MVSFILSSFSIYFIILWWFLALRDIWFCRMKKNGPADFVLFYVWYICLLPCFQKVFFYFFRKFKHKVRQKLISFDGLSWTLHRQQVFIFSIFSKSALQDGVGQLHGDDLARIFFFKWSLRGYKRRLKKENSSFIDPVRLGVTTLKGRFVPGLILLWWAKYWEIWIFFDFRMGYWFYIDFVLIFSFFHLFYKKIHFLFRSDQKLISPTSVTNTKLLKVKTFIIKYKLNIKLNLKTVQFRNELKFSHKNLLINRHI